MHPWENVMAYLLLLLWLIRANLLLEMPHKRSGSHLLECRRQKFWIIFWLNINILTHHHPHPHPYPDPTHTHFQGPHVHTPLGKACLPPFSPFSGPLGQPGSSDGPITRCLEDQPLKQLEMTEQSGHFSQDAMVKLGWDSFRSIYTLILSDFMVLLLSWLQKKNIFVKIYITALSLWRRHFKTPFPVRA